MAQQIISLETIDKDARWIVKLQGYREAGTRAEIQHILDDPDADIRDIGLAANQPEYLQPFFDGYFSWIRKNSYISYGEYYKDIYLEDIQKDVEAEAEKPKTKKVWTEDEIRNLIQTNDRILYKGFLKLYERQTAGEQRQGETRERNGVGFNALDAGFLTSCAEWLKKKGYLSDKQKYHVRRKLAKYNRQLTEIANEGR